MTCRHDYKNKVSAGKLEEHAECEKCGSIVPIPCGRTWNAAMRLASAALAERDKEIERMSNTLKTVKAAMEVVSRTELDGSGGRDAIAKRVEKRHGNAMAMAFKEVFDVLAAT